MQIDKVEASNFILQGRVIWYGTVSVCEIFSRCKGGPVDPAPEQDGYHARVPDGDQGARTISYRVTFDVNWVLLILFVLDIRQ